MDYPSNNKTSPNGPQKREKRISAPVIEGKIVQRKKSLGQRVTAVFIAGDPKTAGRDTIQQVLIPSIRETLLAISKTYLESLFLGDRVRVSRRDVFTTARDKVAYNRMHQSSGQSQQKPVSQTKQLTFQQRASHDFDEICLAERADVTQIIGSLQECIEQYGMARVSDLYDAVGITSEFTDEAWGWTDLSGAGARYTSDGYLLDLPKPVPLN